MRVSAQAEALVQHSPARRSFEADKEKARAQQKTTCDRDSVRMPKLFAQSLGEYGGIASLSSTIQQLTYSIGAWVGSVSTTTWVIAAVAVLGLLILTRR